MASKYSMNDRPSWPRRAIVTAGEPYGNKGLHFGHVGGVFVPADFFARFLRDRLGRENVMKKSAGKRMGRKRPVVMTKEATARSVVRW